MKKLIIITGPMGVGKTTVGKNLSDKISRSAFIDGDWCLNIHPFVGNRETKNMAIDNIVHMIKNYNKCSECDSVVLGWVMSENTINKIVSGIADMDFQIFCFTLTVSGQALIQRWKNDVETEWRTNEELNNSLVSLEDYLNRKNTHIIDTSDISADGVLEQILERIK